MTGRTWKGTAFGGVKGRSQPPGMVEDAMAGHIDLAPFVTHTRPLELINEAFDLMHAGVLKRICPMPAGAFQAPSATLRPGQNFSPEAH